MKKIYLNNAAVSGLLSLIILAIFGLRQVNAADNVLENFGNPVRWYHLYSGDDGISHLNEMPVPVSAGQAGTTVLFNGKARNVAISYWPDGFKYEWHNPSRPIVSVYLQGTQVIQTGDGLEHRIGPGSLLLVEDVKGRGHRFRCEAKDKKAVCLFMQVSLEDAFQAALISPPTAAATVPIERPRFDADIAPVAPDYKDPTAWAALPDHPDAADGSPPNDVYPDGQATARADVFFVHPTTYHKEHWNQPLGDAETNEWTDTSVIARQASAFNACCKVYAPRYRQAVTGAFGDTTGDGAKAYDLAYEDVRTAFRYYLDHYNHGRPFILAGHSQGGLMVKRLVAEFIDAKPLKDRFIAAYAIGVGISEGEFGHTFSTVQPCRSPADLACVISWNSYVREGDPTGFRAEQERPYLERYGAAGKTLLCVNPLTFDMKQPAAAANANLGALPGAPSREPLPALIPAAAAAACVDGVLIVDPPKDPAFTLKLLPHGFFHYHDIDTFYENVRANAVLRTRTFLGSSLNQ